jgi:hypothetical protein
VLVDAADYYHAVYWAISRAQSYVLDVGLAVRQRCPAPAPR